MIGSVVGFVPAAPLLVADLAGEARDRDAAARAACGSVVRDVAAAGHDGVTVLAAVTTTEDWVESAVWDFAGFGVARQSRPRGPVLPWPLGVGAWWLDQVGYAGRRRYVGIDDVPEPSTAPQSGAVLVVGDGSARRHERAPGHLDPRAESFDAAIRAALIAGDIAALGGIDGELAGELMCSGASTWRTLARWIGDRSVDSSELRLETAEYGVAYFAALWRLAET